MKRLTTIVATGTMGFCLAAMGDETRLEDLPNLNLIEIGHGSPTKDRAVSGQPLQMAGEKFKHGLGVHAPCVALIKLDGNTEKFHAVVGVNDLGKNEPGSVEFIVAGDGKVFYKSGVIKGGEKPKVVDLALSGVKNVKLEVTNGGDNDNSDHANWANASFTWKGTAPRLVDSFCESVFPAVGVAIPMPKAKNADNPWLSQWIGPERADANTWICFRKSFEVGSIPSVVPVRVAVDSKYWLWVNGKMVIREGGLKRGPTPNDGYYDVLNIAPYLKNGHNTIAVLAWYWGKQGFSHKSSGKPGFVMETKIEKLAIVTDRTWRMRIHPAFGTAGDPTPNYRLAESAILFDATKDIAGWMEPSYDDSSWAAPVEAGTPPVAPWGNLVQRPIPLWKDYGLKAYTNASALPAVSDGKVIKAALPYNAHVTPYFKIDATAGQRIDIRTDDIHGGGEPGIHAEYITRDGVQEYETPGWMNGHEVEYTIPAGVKILSLQFRESGYNAEFAGSFGCDDPFFNTLWEKSKRTLYVTMRDNYMDCPDRERAQWWGDAVNEIGEAFYVFDPPGNQLARKAILELANWQRPNKTMYSPVPSGNWGAELPPQMLASVGKYGFWTYYFYTGDVETMRTVYPHVRDYLTLWKVDEDGLVIHRKGDWDWSDWGGNIDVRLLDSLWYHLALQGAAEMAPLCGAEGDLPGWRARMAAVEKGVNAKCWNGTEYRSPGYTGDTDDRGNGLAVVAGIAGPAKYGTLREVLDKHRNASPYMEKYVLEALFMMGEPQLGLDRMKQRYDGMVKRPISTLAENMDGSGTYNHAWSGGPLTIMSQYVTGVAPDKAAYEQYHVLPQMGSLTTIEAVTPTVKGNIHVSMKRDAATFGLNLVSPAGTTATVGIPLEKERRMTQVEINEKAVWKDGKPGESLPGVACEGEDARYCRFKVASGRWHFTANYESLKSPANMTYYVDPTNGSDENSGTSTDKPWRSLKTVNRLILASGDRIELRPGAFSETLAPSGEGTAKDPIVIHFAPGEYEFHPDNALKLKLHITNTNDAPNAPKAIALAFQGVRHVRVIGGAEGKRSDLYMRGTMIQTFFDRAEDVRLQGLTFDYRRPTTSEYTVLEVASDHADLAIHKDSKYAIEKGHMVWVGEGWRHDAFRQGAQQQGDPVEGTLWRDGIQFDKVSKIEELSAGKIRVYFSKNPGFVKGRIWQERDPYRDCTGSFARNSKDIVWEDCAYHYMHGMGLVNQFCENLTLKKVDLAPRPGSGRTCACWADAIQVSGCRGQFIAEDCSFSGTQDDPINVHGTHLRIVERRAADQLLVRFCHGQTYGFESFFAGDEIDFVHADSLRIFASGKVKKAEMKGERDMLLTLEKPAPDGIAANDVLENVTWTPEVEIRNCRIGMCSTRGFLITTRRKVLVENNTFKKTAMSAILVSDDARNWFESGPVRDMTIRGNRFIKCGIDISPENAAAKPEESVHENIRIENNFFDRARIYAKSVKGLVITGNRFTSENVPIDTNGCTDVVNEHNTPNAVDTLGANQLQVGDFPLRLSEIRVRDPFILADVATRTYYLYAQCGNRLNNDSAGIGVEVYRSKDLVNWTVSERVFTRPKSNFWGGAEIWAPEVHKLGDTYFMFVSFPGRDGGRGTQILRADRPEGPFLIAGDGANTPPEQRCLDGTPWIDADGTHWLIYCHEWCQIHDGAVRAVRMTNNWTARHGDSILLFKASEAPWVRSIGDNNYVTDGPFLYRTQGEKGGQLLMIWSSFRKGGDYAVGVAASESGTVKGPWRHSKAVLFGEGGGHGMIFRDLSGNLLLVLHQPNSGNRERAQLLKLKEEDGRLVVFR